MKILSGSLLVKAQATMARRQEKTPLIWQAITADSASVCETMDGHRNVGLGDHGPHDLALGRGIFAGVSEGEEGEFAGGRRAESILCSVQSSGKQAIH